MDVKKIWESTTTKIVPCLACNGEGVIHTEELVDYHRRDYDTFTEICKKCDGEGRMLAIKTQLQFAVIGNDGKVIRHKTEEISVEEKLNGRGVTAVYKLS